MTVTNTHTYCRICEALCGYIATVEDGVLVQMRPNKDHPMSRGFGCPKGVAMTELVNDPDRVLYPLRRKPGVPRGQGGLEQFERISWEQAFDEIASKLRSVVDTHGGSAVGAYLGNPVYFSYSPPMWVKGFIDALQSPHFYTPGSQDTASRSAASAFLYGSALLFPIPDLERTDFLLMLGANPFVSHGSLLTAPHIKETLRAIPKRGGRVVVVDPRRTETARVFEHLQVRPDSDAWLLGAMLRVIFDEGLEDREAIAKTSRGIEMLRQMVAGDTFTCEEAARRTGIPADQIRQLARDLAIARSAAVYGRIGTCRGRHGTLTVFLLDALNVVTGNFDRPGGSLLGKSLTPPAFNKAADTFGKHFGRIGGFPDAFGMLPSVMMGKEMLTPGDGQLRAFFTVGGNPVLANPNPDELTRGIKGLELMVSIDLYVSETGLLADYILPGTTFLEKHDVPLQFAPYHIVPFAESTEPVIAPRGESKDEWQIIDEIARRIGIAPYSAPALRTAARFGIRPKPRTLVDLAVRLGPYGDFFGLRRNGLSLKKLTAATNGIQLGEHQPTGEQRKRIRHRDGLVHLDAPAVLAESRRLGDRHRADPDLPLSLITLRELHSHNSWMHNLPSLMTARRKHTARVHPKDAASAGLMNGDRVRIVSASGEIETEVLVTDEIIEGTVAVPHGWGHRSAGWRRANDAGGPNINVLASTEIADVEKIAGMTLLDGIPVRLEPVAGDSPAPTPEFATRP
ncbi:formate dehydrogenase [Mycobacterium triplex]|uniref:Formate dehydrogenase n=1 Tax=Mycobacterium triplex TaxID=47839 RepID=A0A024K425_9MYCO|nr:molybdopterin-dependent oxidoreductase [Mycobacterium triplex]ORW99954.1 formate dehydrogenase [Mycobacterium triplex]CDO90223.1 molybdopterin oxidoreductase [Mycobacterium triplex]